MSADKFKFGNGTCSTIEVEPFAPICHKPDVPGSEALTLEVPAPVFAPVVPPQECACFTFAKGEAEVAVKTSNQRPLPKSKVAVAITQETDDCCSGAYKITPTFEIYIPEPPTPHLCLAETTIQVKAKYHDEDAEDQTRTVASNAATVSVTLENGCPKYNFGEIMLDLTGIPTGGFGNGGSVFKDDDDNNLYMDGGLGAGDTWYGGGIGDRAANNYEELVFCRGPAMRGYASPAGSGDHPVPYVNNVSDNTSLFKITTDGGTRQAVAWCSRGRASDGSDAVGATPNGYVDGNLSMVLPTGFQWHSKGLAINLCDFEWNESGLLSLMHETGMAALVSPAPSLFKSTASAVSGVTRASMNASGLAIYPRGTNPLRDPGLFVNDGNGLRIFGVDAKTTSSGTTETWNADKLGTLEVYGHSGDFLFNYDGKMVINDSKSPARTDTSASANTRERIIEAPTFSSVFDRTTDGILLMATADANATHDAEGEDFVWDFNSAKYLQVSTVGMYAWYDSAHSYWTGAKYYLDHIGGQTSSGTTITAETVVGDLVPAVRDTLATIDRIIRTLGTLCMAPLAFSKAGTLLSTSSGPISNGIPMGYRTAQNIARHYAASAS